jgi:hypothetical protein
MQTFTGREYLKIDIANNFGLDKLEWEDRINWFDQQGSNLPNLITQAKEPALFYAGLKAFNEVQNERPIGYMISLDATASGLQLLACLTGDPHAAALCNVIDTGTREDAYVKIYQFMLNNVADKSAMSREDTKYAIMTSLYQSKAVPRLVFGDGATLDVFYNTMATLAPGAWELNEAMPAFWDPTALEHSWILPDNFHCHIKVMDQVRERVRFFNSPFDVFYSVNQPMDEGRSLGANTIHSIDGMIVRELGRRCMYDRTRVQRIYTLLAEGNFGNPDDSPAEAEMVRTLWDNYTRSGYLSARIIDHLDENTLSLVNSSDIQELLDSLPFKPFTIVSVHDCFRCLPHYGNDLRQQYNLQLQLIAKSNLLQDIISQLVGRPITLNKLDPQLWQRIGQTNYALS